MTPPTKTCPSCGRQCPPKALRCRGCDQWFPVAQPRRRSPTVALACLLLILLVLCGRLAVREARETRPAVGPFSSGPFGGDPSGKVEVVITAIQGNFVLGWARNYTGYFLKDLTLILSCEVQEERSGFIVGSHLEEVAVRVAVTGSSPGYLQGFILGPLPDGKPTAFRVVEHRDGREVPVPFTARIEPD